MELVKGLMKYNLNSTWVLGATMAYLVSESSGTPPLLEELDSTLISLDASRGLKKVLSVWAPGVALASVATAESSI